MLFRSWLYHHATALISASSEDFGLTPVEAAACGTPSVLLRGGGFLDTCIDGVNGVFFDEPTPSHIARAVEAAASRAWNHDAIRATVERFEPRQFARSLSAAASAHFRGDLTLPNGEEHTVELALAPDSTRVQDIAPRVALAALEGTLGFP